MNIATILTTTKNVAHHVVTTWYGRDMGFKAAGLTYYALFALIPLFLLLFIISSILIDQQFIAGEINTFIREVFSASVVERLQELIDSLVSNQYSLPVSISGLLLLLYGVSSYFIRLNLVIKGVIIGMAKESLTISQNIFARLKSLFYSLFLFFFITLVSLSSTLSEYFYGLLDSNEEVLFSLHFIEIITSSIALLLLVFLFLVFYKSISQSRVSWSNSLIGAVVVSVLALLLNELFAYALSFSITFQNYGFFSAILAIILWIYLINSILIIGALVIKFYSDEVNSDRATVES